MIIRKSTTCMDMVSTKHCVRMERETLRPIIDCINETIGTFDARNTMDIHIYPDGDVVVLEAIVFDGDIKVPTEEVLEKGSWEKAVAEKLAKEIQAKKEAIPVTVEIDGKAFAKTVIDAINSTSGKSALTVN